MFPRTPVTQKPIKMSSPKIVPVIAMIPLLWANLAVSVTAQPMSKTSCEIDASNRERAGLQIRAQDFGKKEKVTSFTPSQTAISTPSLWWAVEQYDPLDGKLITYWEANPNTNVINLVVNNRFWQTLDYLEQYSLVNQFGTVARDYRYHLNLISQQDDCLATYTCDLSVTPPQCQIQLNIF